MKIKHPYQHLESHPLWKVVEKALNDLRKNGDLGETTRQSYVVGYLVQEVLKSERAGASVTPRGQPATPETAGKNGI